MKAILFLLTLGFWVVPGVSGCASSAAQDPRRALKPATPMRLPAQQDVDYPQEPPTRVVKIVGNMPGVDFATWQNTGISLKDGDVLYVQAEGQINYVADLTLTPDGWGDRYPPALLPSISFMALVGRMNTFLLDDGIDSSGIGVYGPGFVGSRFKTTYHGPSEYGLTGDNVLYLAVNDSMDNDNSGSFTASLWVVREGRAIHFK